MWSGAWHTVSIPENRVSLKHLLPACSHAAALSCIFSRAPRPRTREPASSVVMALPLALIYFKSLFTPAVARPPRASPGPLPCTESACCLQSNLGLLPGTRSPHAEAVEEVGLETHCTTARRGCRERGEFPILPPDPPLPESSLRLTASTTGLSSGPCEWTVLELRLACAEPTEGGR